MFKLAKSAAEGIVCLFAAYAFAFIPLGKRTALQHVIAILHTKEAAEAGQELKQAGGRMVDELLNQNLAGEPQLPKLKPPQSKLSLRSELDAGVEAVHGVDDEPAASSEHAPPSRTARPAPASTP